MFLVAMSESLRIIRRRTLAKKGGTFLTTRIRSIMRTITPVLILGALAATAYADPISVAGRTRGSFNGGTSANFRGLRYTWANFATPTTGPTPESQRLMLGSFSLSSSIFNYNNQGFSLSVTFTRPAGAGSWVNALVSGRVTANGVEGGKEPTINFGGPQRIVFEGGSFLLDVEDVVFTAAGIQNVYGNIYGGVLDAATPEPQSILLLSTAIGGLGLLFRKRLGRNMA